MNNDYSWSFEPATDACLHMYLPLSDSDCSMLWVCHIHRTLIRDCEQVTAAPGESTDLVIIFSVRHVIAIVCRRHRSELEPRLQRLTYRGCEGGWSVASRGGRGETLGARGGGVEGIVVWEGDVGGGQRVQAEA